MRVTNSLIERDRVIELLSRRIEKHAVVELEVASDSIQQTGRTHIYQPSHRPKHLRQRRHVAENMQAITNLRHAKLAQIPIDVFDEMRNLASAHLRQRNGYTLWREFVIPIMFVIAMIARQHVSQIEVGLQVRILNQLPYLLLNETAASTDPAFLPRSTH